MVKPVFHFLSAVDTETLSVSKLELFVITANNFEPLTVVVKIPVEFLNLHMATKGYY